MACSRPSRHFFVQSERTESTKKSHDTRVQTSIQIHAKLKQIEKTGEKNETANRERLDAVSADGVCRSWLVS